MNTFLQIPKWFKILTTTNLLVSQPLKVLFAFYGFKNRLVTYKKHSFQFNYLNKKKAHLSSVLTLKFQIFITVKGNNQSQTRTKKNKKPGLLTVQSAVLVGNY